MEPRDYLSALSENSESLAVNLESLLKKVDSLESITNRLFKAYKGREISGLDFQDLREAVDAVQDLFTTAQEDLNEIVEATNEFDSEYFSEEPDLPED